MNRSTKGAIAAAAAAVLLLGGAGSLAYWTDDGDVNGGSLDSGSLTLSTPTCDDWLFDGGDTYTPGVSTIVPGDEITRECEATLDAEGDHIGADLTIDPAAFAATNDLTDELVLDADFTVDGDPVAAITAPGSYTIGASISVVFDGPAATNDSQSLTAALDAITISAVQTHTP